MQHDRYKLHEASTTWFKLDVHHWMKVGAFPSSLKVLWWLSTCFLQQPIIKSCSAPICLVQQCNCWSNGLTAAKV